MGAEEERVQPNRNDSGKSVGVSAMGWMNVLASRSVYENALVTCVLEYSLILLFGISIIIEYYHNVYQQQYFGSFNPVFLVIVLMASAGYGFARLVNLLGVFGKKDVAGKKKREEEDDY